MKKTRIILIAAGGTGGHLFPAKSLAKTLEKKKYRVIIMTDKRGRKLFNINEGYELATIFVSGVAGKNILIKITSIIKIFISTVTTLFFLIKKRPSAVIGFGSYVQVPALIAARILNIPILLHEANRVIGKSNNIFWNKAKIRTSAFKEILGDSRGSIHVGMPVRDNIKEIYYKDYICPSSDKEKINILITGGSLGAKSISTEACKALCSLPIKLRKKIYVVHQVRKEYILQINNLYKKSQIKVRLYSFIEDISVHLGKTHLVISRAGASTIAENLVAGRPSIYIPLPNSIDSHQLHNAEYVVSRGAAWLQKDEKYLSEKLLVLLKNILLDYAILEKKSSKNKSLAMPNATITLGKLVDEIVI